MDFWKINGAGNDFIIVEDLQQRMADESLPAIAGILCRRHMSIGADGFMVVRPAEKGGDFRMLFFNSDGSVGEMCGNGVRCICRYGYEKGLSSEEQKVETMAGMIYGTRIDASRYRVRLNLPTVLRCNIPLPLKEGKRLCSYLELGKPGLPHAVVEYPGLQEATWETLRPLARECRFHPQFPRGANITLYEVKAPDCLAAITYERGVEDFTYACGTGAASAATVLTLQGRSSGEVTVDMPGGQLSIHVDAKEGRVENLFLTGPTNIVCTGTVTDENLPCARERS